jgi:Ca2+-binding EF-hand superfamily protein
VLGKVDEAIDSITMNVGKLIGDARTEIIGHVKSGVNDILGGVGDWFSRLINAFIEAFDKVKDKLDVLNNTLGLLNPIKTALELTKSELEILNRHGWVDKLRDMLLGLYEKIVGGGKEVLSKIWNALTGLVGWIVEKMKSGIGHIASALIPAQRKVEKEDDVWDIVGDVIGKIFTIALPFAIATIAGELIHPLKELGFGQVAALLWHAAAFDKIGEDLIGTITYALMTLPLRYALFYWSTPRIPEEEMIFPLIERGVLDKDKFIDVFKRMGYSEYWGQLYWDVHWQEPDLYDLNQMLWRGLLTEEEYKNWLKYIGYEPSLWDKYLELTKRIPPASDLIEFVVKEAFPLENLPPAPEEFTKYMKMQGYDEKWARAYWWVHWRMPSFEQLQKAFFRGIITEEEFKKYIVWWDYAPFARPGISKSDQEIMYELIWNMPDKLDIRWMLRWGIITQEEAKKLFAMTGIHPDWLDKVVEANFMNMFMDERTQLRNAVLGLYGDGYITEQEAREMLLASKFTPEEVDLLIQAYKWRREKDLNDLTLEYYKELLKKGIIDKGKFVGDLVQMGWDRERLERLAELLELKYQKIDRVDETKDDRNRVRTQLVNMYKEGYITKDELRAELEALGYTADEIDLTIKEAELKYLYDYYSDIVRVLKEAFRKGQLTLEELKAELSKIIKVPERIEALVALWNLQNMPKPKIQQVPT